MNNESVIVCLPVFNEEKAIENMIAQLKELPFKIIISDGGSTDKSLQIAKKEAIDIFHRPGKSKGYGMLQAINLAQKNNIEYIVFIDCDLTYPVDKIPDLVSQIQSEKYDMVVGRRSTKSMSLKSKILNHILRNLIYLLFGGNLQDPASGLRVLRTESYCGNIKEIGMDLEIELTGFSLKKNLLVKEIEVDYYSRVGKSKLRLQDIIQALFTVFKVRFRQY